MPTPDGIPIGCQGRCPLEPLGSELVSKISFTLNCDDPKPIDTEPAKYEYDINADGTVTKPTGQDREIGNMACTNTGARLWVEDEISEI